MLQVLEYRKAESKLQFPEGKGTGLFPSRALALWEELAISLPTWERGGLGEVWKTRAQRLPPEGRLVGGEVERGGKSGG